MKFALLRATGRLRNGKMCRLITHEQEVGGSILTRATSAGHLAEFTRAELV